MSTQTLIQTIQETWPSEHPNDLQFSANHVIEAYTIGKEYGRQIIQEGLIKLLSSNIRHAAEMRDKLVQEMERISLHALRAYLNVEALEKLSVLVVVPEEEYLEDRFLKVYQIVSNLKKTARESSYYLNFYFVANSSHLDEEQIAFDGYINPVNLDAA